MNEKLHFKIKTVITVVTITLSLMWFSKEVTKAANFEISSIVFDDFDKIDTAVYNYRRLKKDVCPSISDLHNDQLIKGPENIHIGLSQKLDRYHIKDDGGHCTVSVPSPTKDEAVKALEHSVLGFVPAFFYGDIDNCYSMYMNHSLPGRCESANRINFTIDYGAKLDSAIKFRTDQHKKAAAWPFDA